MEIIERTCEPTKCDIYPRYTIMKVLQGKQYGGVLAPLYFIQMSDEDAPVWCPISSLFDNIAHFALLYENKEFVQELINLAFDLKRPFTHLSKLLESTDRVS